jgi:ZIP family zinc transporter
MLYVSFVEIFFKGVDALVAVYGESAGHWINAASFLGGMFLIGVIDNLVPQLSGGPGDVPGGASGPQPGLGLSQGRSRSTTSRKASCF